MKNENRSGYKKTKVGWIPEEWKLGPMGKIADVRDGTHESPKFHSKGFPLVTSKNLRKNGSLDLSNTKNISEEDFVNINKRSGVQKGDILFGMIGTIGNPVLLNSDGFAIKNVALIKQGIGVLNRHLLSVLNSTVIDRQFHRLNAGGTQKFIALGVIRDLQVPVPPLKEQEAIAEVLECWDAGIRSLEKKIELKRNIKKGLMQKLLSGQSRLPGFSGEWETAKLGQVLKIGSGKDYKHLATGSIPVFGTGGLMTHVDTALHSGETVFIGRKGTIDKPFYFNGDFWTVDTLFYTYDFSGITPRFLLPVFQKINWKKYNEASGVPSLSKVIISQIKIVLPSLKEQKAIAEVLSDADQEIEKLEAKLARWKDQKTYLLNELVTGAKRVPLFE